jgi:hypothetical protein
VVVLPRGSEVAGLTYNLSHTGIGVALLRAVPVGTKVVVEKGGWCNARPLHATVLRHQPLAFAFLHGCRLSTPLSEEELQDWLK